MDAILEQAKKLAELIAANERTKELREATAGIAGDASAKQLEEDYARATADYHRLDETGRPIEPVLKHRLLDLQGRIRQSTTLQRLLRAHADFAEMMDGVQRTIGSVVDEALAGPDGAAEAPPEAEPKKPEEPGSGRILWTP